MDNLKKLVEFVKEGEDDKAADLAKKIIEKTDPVSIINALTEGMRELGDLYERKVIFLPELLIASDALTSVMEIVEPRLNDVTSETRERSVVIGTVQGDIHDIGKNIVVMVLKANRYKVTDLGKDVETERFVETARTGNANIIGLSTLMSVTMKNQKRVIEILKERNQRNEHVVIVGGAPVSERWAKEIGADGYSPDAFKAARYLNSLYGGNQGIET
jgi:dimethylamine corrinoid protein